jgi:hypothetical protein
MDLYVFDIFYLFFIFYYLDGSVSNEYAYRSDFLKYDFLLFLWTCKLLPLYIVFSQPINIWGFFAPSFTTQVGFQFGIVCPNMSTNINVNFHTLGNHLISYNSMQDQIFISCAIE